MQDLAAARLVEPTAAGAPATLQAEDFEGNPPEAELSAAPGQHQTSGDIHSQGRAGQVGTATQPTQPAGTNNRNADIRKCGVRAAPNPALRPGPLVLASPNKAVGASHSKPQATVNRARTVAEPAQASSAGRKAANQTGRAVVTVVASAHSHASGANGARGKPADGHLGTTAAQALPQPTAPQLAAAANTAAGTTAHEATALARAAAFCTLAAMRHVATGATAVTAATAPANSTIGAASNQPAAGKQQHHSRKESGPVQSSSSNSCQARCNKAGHFECSKLAQATRASAAPKPRTAPVTGPTPAQEPSPAKGSQHPFQKRKAQLQSGPTAAEGQTAKKPRPYVETIDLTVGHSPGPPISSKVVDHEEDDVIVIDDEEAGAPSAQSDGERCSAPADRSRLTM